MHFGRSINQLLELNGADKFVACLVRTLFLLVYLKLVYMQTIVVCFYYCFILSELNELPVEL